MRWGMVSPAFVGIAASVVAGMALLAAPGDAAVERPYRAVLPQVARSDAPTPTPTTPALPYVGPIASIALGSAGLNSTLLEERDTHYQGSREVFDDPSRPERIAWYPRFGRPGFRGHNTILAAHINYVGYGNGPFAHLTSVAAGDALYLTMANGATYAYTVKSVSVVKLSELDMDAVVFAYGMDPSHTERVTLISCGGTFVPYPGGGGEYDSRVVLVAERWVE